MWESISFALLHDSEDGFGRDLSYILYAFSITYVG